ncbi:hypothetical protein MT418_005998 [Batrachochytrium dendrobatidis]
MHPNAFQMKLDKYFNVSSNHCVIAVVLDPRHKLEFYDDENQNAQENASQKEKIKRQIQSVYAEYHNQSGLMQLKVFKTALDLSDNHMRNYLYLNFVTLISLEFECTYSSK